MKFSLPDVILVPNLSHVQDAVSQLAQKIIDISSNIYWWDSDMKQTFHDAIINNESVYQIKRKIDTIIIGRNINVSLPNLSFEEPLLC